MAVEMALMERARATGEAVFRVYTWRTPTLSFGRNQTAHGWYDPARLQEAGVAAVRRPTGGRAILHHREITYSVTAPAPPSLSLKGAYTRINALLLDALHRLGVPAAVASPDGRAARPSAAPCFETPSAGEMTAGGRKLVGSAQWRDDGVLLQHGSILVDNDQTRLSDFMTIPSPTVPTPATLRTLLGRAPDAIDMATAVAAVVRSHEDADASEICSDDVISASKPFVAKFADPAWTWRR
jgi:lipoate-protein ligase A